MNRDEIYDHLAQVYLGKRKEVVAKKKQKFDAWLVINIFITLIIFCSAFYGLTAFLTQRSTAFRNNIIYSLHHGIIRLNYNLANSFTEVETFTLSVPPMDASRYKRIHFSIRAKEHGNPGMLKVVIRNEKNETSYYYAKNIDREWQEFNIPLSAFDEISDWTNLKDISFILESWNIDDKKGGILIDDVSFSS